jgi:hypothetical protein
MASVLAFAERVFRIVAAVLFALFLLSLVPGAAWRSGKRLVLAVRLAGESVGEARERTLGPAYVAALSAIRRAVPEEGEYFLVNFGAEREGGPYWVRFELAPRRARFLGQWQDLTDRPTLVRRLAAGPRDVVVAFRDGKPPLLYDHASFLQALRRRRGGS